MHFTKKQNNVQAFVNLHIHRTILFCREYSPQEICSILLSRKNHSKKVSINFTGDKGFHILLLLSDHMLLMMAD